MAKKLSREQKAKYFKLTWQDQRSRDAYKTRQKKEVILGSCKMDNDLSLTAEQTEN